jgi:hypothetical protein
MRNAFIAVLLTLVSLGCVAQDSTLKADGRLWGAFDSPSAKAAYVQGAVEGLRAGAARGYVRGWVDKKQQADSGTNDEKAVTAGMEKVLAMYTPRASVLDIVHQMDKFTATTRTHPFA